jgi:G3E family GTPase
LRIAATIVMAETAGLPELAADNQIGGLIRSQLSAADLLILNKTDLARPPQLTAGRRWLTENLPDIPVLEVAHADLPAAMILGAEAVEPLAPPPAHQHGPDFAHTLFTTDKPLDRETFRQILDQLAPHIIRAKGFVRFSDKLDALEVLQLTGRRWSLEAAGNLGANDLSTRLAFIALAAGFDENELLTQISNAVDDQRPMANQIGEEHGG